MGLREWNRHMIISAHFFAAFFGIKFLFREAGYELIHGGGDTHLSGQRGMLKNFGDEPFF